MERDESMRVSLIACAIGLACNGEAHETKTEMAGDCARRLAAGIRHGIIVVATRPDHRRIVAHDPKIDLYSSPIPSWFRNG
jgi:hypothetical protein